MFSRKEREYLRLIAAHGPSAVDPDAALRAAFPNPTYRRKLSWAVRRKVARTALDWDLYSRAARAEPGLIPSVLPAGPPELPVVADPLVSALRAVRRSNGRSPRRRKGP